MLRSIDMATPTKQLTRDMSFSTFLTHSPEFRNDGERGQSNNERGIFRTMISAGLLSLTMMIPVKAEEKKAEVKPGMEAVKPPGPAFPAGFISFSMKESAATGFRYITIQVNGEDVNLMVDSGMAGEMVISKKTADALGAKPQTQAGGIGITGAVAGTVSVFKSMKLMAGAEAPNVPMNVLEMPDHLLIMGEDGKTPMHYGILGSMFLSVGKAAYSPHDSQLFLPSAAAAGTYRKVREEAGDRAFALSRGAMGEPLVELEIQGKKYVFLIDTAAQGNAMLPEVGKALKLSTRLSNRVVSGVSQTAISQPQEADVEDVKLGGKVAMKVNFLLVDIPPLMALKKEGAELGGILGIGWLKDLQARIDFDTYTLLLPAVKK